MVNYMKLDKIYIKIKAKSHSPSRAADSGVNAWHPGQAWREGLAHRPQSPHPPILYFTIFRGTTSVGINIRFLYFRLLFTSTSHIPNSGAVGLIHRFAMVFLAENNVLFRNILANLSISSGSGYIPSRHGLGYKVIGEPMVSWRNPANSLKTSYPSHRIQIG